MENLQNLKNEQKIITARNEYIKEETTLLYRKEIFGPEKDLEKLQEEFLKTKNEKNLSVKINKIQSGNKNLKENEILFPESTGKISKKKKDFIKMDLNFDCFKEVNKKEEKNQSLFNQSIENHLSELNDEIINKDTGLPDTFKISLNPKVNELNNIKENINRKINSTNRDKFINEMNKLSSKIPNDEYKNIHDSNISAITKMSKEELIQYQEVIKAKIPENLREKMKQGYFQKKLKEETKKLNLKQEKLKEIEDESNSQNISNDINKNDEDTLLTSKTSKTIENSNFENIKNDSANFLYVLLINYNGEFSLKSEKVIKKDDHNKTSIQQTIDYSKCKFNEIDLNTKFFTIHEIYNLLSSSSEQQILLGLKLSKYIVDFYFDPKRNEKISLIHSNSANEISTPVSSNVTNSFIKQIENLNFWNVYYNLIEYKNMNIKSFALEGFVDFIFKLNRDEFKSYKNNIFKFSKFPVIKSFKNDEDDNENIKLFECFHNNLHKNLTFLKNHFIVLTNMNRCSNPLDQQNMINSLKFLYLCLYFSEDFVAEFFKSEMESLYIRFIEGKKEIFSSINFDNSSKPLWKILKNIFIELFIQVSNTEIITKYQNLFENNYLEVFMHDPFINFITILRGGFDERKILKRLEKIQPQNISDSVIYYNILTKLLNENNLDLILPVINSLMYSKSTQDNLCLDSHMSRKTLKFILNKTKIIQLKIKLFKYSHHSETNEYIPIFSSKDEIKTIEEVLSYTIKISEENLKKNIDLSEKFIFDINFLCEFWNFIIKFYEISLKYPNSIKYMQPINNKIIEKLIDPTFKITKIYLNHIEKLSKSTHDSENEKNSSWLPSAHIRFLYKIENFTNYLLSFLKYFSRYHKETYDEIVNLFYVFPSFLNTNSEYYYNKFIKYLTILIYKKSTDEKIQNFLKKLNFSFDELFIDLNLYLGSNEDLRKSTVIKKILYLNEHLSEVILKFDKPSQNTFITKSKFLPFKKNFILQILFNKNIKYELKRNYVVLIIVLFFNQKVKLENLNFFEVILKILMNFGDELISEKNSELIISEFIKNLVLFENVGGCESVKKINLNKNLETEILLENFFDKFEFSNYNEGGIKFYYKFMLLFIAMFHSYFSLKIKSKFKIDKLNLLVYSNFLPILENTRLESLLFLDEYKKNIFIDFVIENLSIDYLEFYEVCLMSYFKFFLNNIKFDDNYQIIKGNVFIELLDKIIIKLDLMKNEDDENGRKQSIEKLYNQFLKDKSSLRNKIQNGLGY